MTNTSDYSEVTTAAPPSALAYLAGNTTTAASFQQNTNVTSGVELARRNGTSVATTQVTRSGSFNSTSVFDRLLNMTTPTTHAVPTEITMNQSRTLATTTVARDDVTVKSVASSLAARDDIVTHWTTTTTTTELPKVSSPIASSLSTALTTNATSARALVAGVLSPTPSYVAPPSSVTSDVAGVLTSSFGRDLGETFYHHEEEDEFTGLHAILGPDAGQDGGPPNLSPLGLVVLIVLTLIGNVIVCLAVKLDKRLHHMTYFFFVSMSALHIAMAASLMPAATVVVLAGQFTYSEELCKLWVTLDFFFCNCTCLHLAFVNMDTFLRLKDPLRHGRVTTRCSLVLWLGAPWSISLVQSVAQFMLSQGDRGVLENGVCFIGDKNFVVLGLLFSFLIPSVIAVAFYALCVNELRKLRAGKFLDTLDTEASSNNAFQYGSMESIPDNLSDSTNCLSDVEVDQADVEDEPGGGGGEIEVNNSNHHHHSDPNGVHLSVVDRLKARRPPDMPSTEIRNSSTKASTSRAAPCKNVETTSFCNELYSHDGARHMDMADEGGNHGGPLQRSASYGAETSSAHNNGRLNVSFSLQEPGPTLDHGTSSLSCALLLQDSAAGCNGNQEQNNGLLSGQVRPNAEHDHSSPDAALREEVAISKLMFLLLLLTVTLWIPHSVSNLVYAVCRHCTQNMSFVTSMAFKWVAYCCGLLGPWIYMKFSEPLRGAMWIMFCCRYCNWDD